MRNPLFVTTAIAILLAAGTAWTGEGNKKDAEVEKALSKIAQLGPGVHAIKTDKQGRITSCIVVGQAKVSTVLGTAKGIQDARTKARLDASGQFVKWLKEKVDVHEKSESETILFLEGKEGNDKNALQESGKSVDKASTKFASSSQGLVRGLQVLHLEVRDKDKTYTLVMGWSAETAKATEKIEKGGDSGSKGDNAKNAGSKTSDKKLEDRKVTSDDAKKFLP